MGLTSPASHPPTHPWEASKKGLWLAWPTITENSWLEGFWVCPSQLAGYAARKQGSPEHLSQLGVHCEDQSHTSVGGVHCHKTLFIRVTILSQFSQDIPGSALKVPYPWKPLSPKQTGP